MADQLDEARWRGHVDAKLEGIGNELIPLRALPQAIAVMQIASEREAVEREKEAKARRKRDEEHDARLARIEEKLDKGNRRRTTLLGLVPVFVALITTAGFLLKG